MEGVWDVSNVDYLVVSLTQSHSIATMFSENERTENPLPFYRYPKVVEAKIPFSHTG